MQIHQDNAWEKEFLAVDQRADAAWKAGKRTAATMFPASDAAYLKSIGCSPQELFDFVDDRNRYGEPSETTTLAVTSIRRRYFVEVMHGRPTGRQVSMDDLPPKAAAVDGIAWLPRLIVKARVKLRGEMPDDLMYGCAGDRPFLREMRMTLPEFLQLVWDKGDDDRAIVNEVKRRAGR